MPKTLAGNVDSPPGETGIFQLTTIRSQGEFNTTVYSDRDRFRGVFGTRMILFMNPADVARQGLEEGEIVGLTTAIDDGIRRHVGGFIVRGYNIPEGCLAGYYPECNPLVPVSHHAKGSFVPAVKGACRCRRMTRLTNAFSKKVQNHAYPMALHFLYYNFVRIHQTLKVAPRDSSRRD